MTFEAIKTSVMKFLKDEDGLTIVEYAVAGGLITAVVAATFTALGTNVETRMNAVCNAVGGGANC
ncbi:Flp family type IVb pilin [Pseudomonas sp. BN411]|uniref:Flp family type IVb pilin n=1 Tax=Pseudomonas sp. BN411 TaxID=2567887 RepID=UPI0024543AF3|nr:Flp family type IVb pilin [Pseudomonas sp. BN411]MDH4559984.1 Flp family type IVb pilin [Pseudomonas sp. BN411]